MRVKEIVILALLTTILVVQEQILAVLPNIQLTFLLIILYTRVLGAKKTSMIIVVYVFLDCLLNSSLAPMISIPMLVGWLLIPLTLSTIARGVKSSLSLAILSIPLSISYTFCFAVAVYIVGEIDISAYLLGDIQFTAILALSSFLTIWWLYDPLYNVMKDLHEKALHS